MFWRRFNLHGISFLKVVACGSNFLVADNFDGVTAVIVADMLENDGKMLSEVSSVAKNLPSTSKSRQHHYRICSKIYLSVRVVKTCKIETSIIFTTQWDIQQNSVNLRIQSKYGKIRTRRKLRIWTLFTQCIHWKKSCKVNRKYILSWGCLWILEWVDFRSDWIYFAIINRTKIWLKYATHN